MHNSYMPTSTKEFNSTDKLCFLLTFDSSYIADKPPVGDWISAPSPNFVDPESMTHRLWLTHDPLIPSITDTVTHRLMGDFVQILGSKFWALGGLNQKSKNVL